ncbi:hypothetical protein [Actinokineospora sp. HUAS TT18]|uniref:hypothetical protein n=1 Tax=Actinokineospora sp. HUAS TT18 TaxID=3447451 RepID=UPI003F5290DB
MTAASTKRPPLIWMTFLDHHDHAVRDQEVATCQSGVYETVCGARLLPAPSDAPPRPDCQRCGSSVLAWFQIRNGLPTGKHKHSRPSWLARLIRSERGRHR